MIGIVLAGGQSKRFGTDKATYSLPGSSQSNVQLAVKKLLPLCEKVIVSVNANNQSRIEKQLTSYFRVTLVTDCPPYDQHGPLSGLLAACKCNPTWNDYLVLAVDYPYLKIKTLRSLASHPNTFVAADNHFHFSLAHFQTNYQTLKTWTGVDNNWRLGEFLMKECHCQPLNFKPSYQFCNLNYLQKRKE